MHIIVESGCDKGPYEFTNMGDVVMLQVCVDRLFRLWPQAQIRVLTSSSSGLARYCPQAKALNNLGRKMWLGDGVSLVFSNAASPTLATVASVIKRTGRRWCPKLLRAGAIHLLKWRGRAGDAEALSQFVGALGDADLIVVCGAGGFSDTCPDWNADTLGLVASAISRGVPVALLGQGLGPLTDSRTLAVARQVLPRATLLTLRGTRGSMPLAASLGLDPGKLKVTGDEAVEAGYQARRAEPGDALGVNVRLGGPAATTEVDVQAVRAALQRFAVRHSASLVPLPIALHPFAQDDVAIKQLLAGIDDRSDGGASLDTPLKVIREAGRCRAVVSGAYHGAVFALAQGIPVVALANSAFFANKLLGLGDLFGTGIEVVTLSEPDLPGRLDVAIERAWQTPLEVRRKLLDAAQRQVDASWRSYKSLQNLVEPQLA